MHLTGIFNDVKISEILNYFPPFLQAKVQPKKPCFCASFVKYCLRKCIHNCMASYTWIKRHSRQMTYLFQCLNNVTYDILYYVLVSKSSFLSYHYRLQEQTKFYIYLTEQKLKTKKRATVTLKTHLDEGRFIIIRGHQRPLFWCWVYSRECSGDKS